MRLAELPEEKQAIDARYSDAVALAASDGSLEHLQEFEQAVKTSSAVVAMSVNTLRALAVNKNELYSNYDLAVRAQARRPANVRNDQQRRAIDGKLWGTAAGEIRYAALSLNGRGLRSYGDCSVTIGSRYISHRATVLQDNSFVFLKDTKFGEDTPLGYRSVWAERYKVAVAKCQSRISDGTDSSEFPSILMKAGNSRSDDDFIEVHIYGGFDFSACEAIVASDVPRTREQRTTLRVVKHYAKMANKEWIDD